MGAPFDPKTSKSKATRLYIDVVIGKKLLHSLMDTGSTNTFMRANGLKVIKARDNKLNLSKKEAVMTT